MTPVEAEIKRRLHEFDICALLRLLAHLGYDQDEIHLRSHHTTATQAGLIVKIDFVS